MLNNMPVTADRCMDAIREHVGTVELEAFIYYVRSQCFDYTKWQREHYDSLSPEALYSSLEEHSKERPFRGKKATII
jgi:hypothetical protein